LWFFPRKSFGCPPKFKRATPKSTLFLGNPPPREGLETPSVAPRHKKVVNPKRKSLFETQPPSAGNRLKAQGKNAQG